MEFLWKYCLLEVQHNLISLIIYIADNYVLILLYLDSYVLFDVIWNQ